MGIAALAWIVFRVATKPSRIMYPCVRAAIPLASGFLGYLLFVGLSLIAWIRLRKRRIASIWLCMVGFGVIGLGISSTFFADLDASTPAQFSTASHDPNNPLGIPIGIFPGRVVWIHQPNATNENCNPRAVGHAWFEAENTDQQVVDSMVSAAIRGLTGVISDSGAWNAIFRFHNTTRGRGPLGYAQGEKIFIKTNATSSWSGNFSPIDLAPNPNSPYYGISETSSAIVLSVMRQLVDVVGVEQTDIYVGDPMKHIYKHCYEHWHAEFPNAHYLDATGYENLGRERVVKSATARIRYSDRGTVLRSNGTTGAPIYEDSLYTVFEEATYIVNIPMLKGHKRAGITMFAKNHFGSHVRSSAAHLHNGLVAPNEEYPPTRAGYGLYRVQVDLLGHELLGRKNLLYLMDALWATDYELDAPLKWMMAPFHNDWMSSIFASLDPLAIESVGYDFLRTEFTEQRGAGTYVQMYGTDDYLHQAADSTNWPGGISYDPENDGTVLGSLGVHEHWNDGVHRQYSRNLGIGAGIELVTASPATSIESQVPTPQRFVLRQNYPNPFNPTTVISFQIPSPGHIRLLVYDMLGREVAVLDDGKREPGLHRVAWDASDYPSGIYFARMTLRDQNSTSARIVKMVLVK
jgi:Domain of unknown function (DUF362)/Secretion system C-terminal sorting domain